MLEEKLVEKPAMEGIEDLRPTPPGSARTWTWGVFAQAWATMMVNSGTFSSGAALLSLGLSVPETLLAQSCGAVILLAGLILNASAGVKYGIPFPVFARSSFGSGGAHFCTLSRGAVAIMWLSFQCWQGVLGIHAALGQVVGRARLRSWGRLGEHLDVAKLVILLLYLGLHAVLIQLGPAKLKRCISSVLPFMVMGILGIAVWAAFLCPVQEALVAAEESTPESIGSKSIAFFAAMNSSIGTWSTLVLNVCDLSRFSPTQKDQALGQALGVPVPFVATLFIGMWLAGATTVAYGKAVWQIPDCFAHWPSMVSVLAGLVLAAATLLVNVLANIISPINDLMNVAPNHFTYRGCGFFVLILSVAVCPWWTFSGRITFVLNFLSGYAMITGAIAGIFMADYWILRRRQLNVEELYTKTGVNWKALLAVLLGAAPLIPGFVDALIHQGGSAGHLVSPVWGHLYSGFSFLFSWSVAGTSYLLLSLGEFRTLRSKELEFSNIASSSSEYSSPNSNSM
ncbi:unnamed protein product [Effrenium voratum]|uniref:Allantoin permease n=1 Tax=Effrenium voratum TaxID=2562239 RepID=A0AA36HXD7_9DINO|nr:unnamed protein product [Effrenium voratum]CAJ1376525.1 unnamed protein product [Effrenium voratum]CAJ1454381.1 unnamed protein product [Effrenium voratum]